MKKYNTFYYLLFILLVTGAFASMAQNSYGLKMMGGVAFGFGLIFFIELMIELVNPQKREKFIILELAFLEILSIIFGLRVFNLRFPFIEIWFATAGSFLALLFFLKLFSRFRALNSQSKFLSLLAIIFHLSLVLFLLALVFFPFKPKIGESAGTIAGALLVLLIIAGLVKRNTIVEGEKANAFTMIKRFKDHSLIMLSLFLLFTLYVGLNRVGVLPGIYSDEYPQAYYDLVNKAASGKVKPAEGKENYEDFKVQYEQFLKNNSGRE